MAGERQYLLGEHKPPRRGGRENLPVGEFILIAEGKTTLPRLGAGKGAKWGRVERG